jgi:predicted transposase YdaD
LSAASAVLGGLSLEKGMIRRIFRRDLMKESVIYQEWRQEIEEEVASRVEDARSRTIALNLLRKDIGIETIAEATGLSIAEVKRLAQQHGFSR